MATNDNNVREQIDEGMLDHISGGYSREHWEQMSPEERVAAYNESKQKRKIDGNAYCAFYDPNA